MNGYGRDHMRELHFRARTDAMITTYFKTPVDVSGLVTSFGLPEFYLRFESPDALNGVVYEIGPTVSNQVYTKRKIFFI